MIALACFLSFIQFLISSLIQIFKTCLENSNSCSSISDNCHEKRRDPAKFCPQDSQVWLKMLFERTKRTLFRGRIQPQGIIPTALPRASTGTGHGHREAECFAAGGSGLPCMMWASPGSAAWLLLPAVLVSS